jgi:hypothetical protein
MEASLLSELSKSAPAVAMATLDPIRLAGSQRRRQSYTLPIAERSPLVLG